MEIEPQNYALLRAKVDRLKEQYLELKDNGNKMADDINGIKEAQYEMKYDIKSLINSYTTNAKVMEKLSEQIEEQDDKSKFDFLSWIKNNFISVCIFIGGIYFYCNS